jgi:hypothetical protein
MEKNLKEKKEKIINIFGETKDNLLESKDNLNQIKKDADDEIQIIDSQIKKIEDTVKIIDITPDEALDEYRDILEPLWSSINGFAISGNKYSHRLKENTNNWQNVGPAIIEESTASDSTFSTPTNIVVSSGQLIAKSFNIMQKPLSEIKIEKAINKKNKIADLLKTVDEKLSQQFIGMWQTYLDDTKKDRAKQAGHSMNEVISILLQKLSDDNDIIKCDWFKPETDNKKPSQRQRAKYAILGKTDIKSLPEGIQDVIDDVSQNIRELYNNIQEIRHNRGDKDAEELVDLLEPYIKSSQDYIEMLFELREKYYSI